MPVNTVYICDHCQAVQTGPKDCYRILVQVSTWEPPPGGPRYHISTETHKVIWCRPCMIEAGLVDPVEAEKGSEPEEPITFEELLEDIIDRRITEKTGAV